MAGEIVITSYPVTNPRRVSLSSMGAGLSGARPYPGEVG